jgi:hypothetical protein
MVSAGLQAGRTRTRWGCVARALRLRIPEGPARSLIPAGRGGLPGGDHGCTASARPQAGRTQDSLGLRFGSAMTTHPRRPCAFSASGLSQLTSGRRRPPTPGRKIPSNSSLLRDDGMRPTSAHARRVSAAPWTSRAARRTGEGTWGVGRGVRGWGGRGEAVNEAPETAWGNASCTRVSTPAVPPAGSSKWSPCLHYMLACNP